MRLLYRLRQGVCLRRNCPKLAFIGERFVAPCFFDDVHAFEKHLSAFLERQIETAELRWIIGPAYAEPKSPIGKNVNKREIARGPQRMIERYHDHRGADLDALRRTCDPAASTWAELTMRYVENKCSAIHTVSYPSSSASLNCRKSSSNACTRSF